MRYVRIFSFILVVGAVAASLSYSQAQKKTQAPPRAPDSNSAKHLKLLSVGAINLKQFAETPRASAPSSNQTHAKGKAKAGIARSTAGSGVSELQVVPEGFAGSGGALVLPTKNSSKAPLKDIHGQVDGALGSGAVTSNQINAAAGATSKSGKTSIFIQTNHATAQESH